MTTDLVAFWSGVPGHAHWHPDDEKVLRRAPHAFQLECLPTSFYGPLKTARVVLLFLSPGFQPADLEHAKSEAAQTYYQTQRTGCAPLPTREQHEGAWEWWTSRVKQFGITADQAAQRLAVLNIGAYKSKSFHDHPMLAALPSSRACLDWAQSVLFPEAEAGKRVVICLRSARYWGLRRDGCCGWLFAPTTTQGGYMTNTPMRAMVNTAVAHAFSDPATILGTEEHF